jgi:ribosomal protein S18 acetylase RimI-like enzyme
MKVTITTPTLSDIDIMHKWGHENPELWYSNQPSWHAKNTLQDMIKNPGKDIFLAAKDGEKTVGMCIVYYMHDWVYLSSLFIVAHFRGKGIGRMLLQKVQILLEPYEFSGLHLVTKFGSSSIDFYKKLGFSEGNHFVWMRKNLKENL